jgi:type III restriction enzyme
VDRFTKLPAQFGFAIEYLDNMNNLRYSEPDFVAVTTDDVHYIVETKGLEDVNVINKNRAAHLWCENASKLTGTPWAYLIVKQKEFAVLQPSSFTDLLILRQPELPPANL